VSASGPSPWLFSRRADLLLFGGPAVASLLLLGLGARTGDLNGELPFVLWVVTVIGVDVAHVWSTGWRVYADLDEFRGHLFEGAARLLDELTPPRGPIQRRDRRSGGVDIPASVRIAADGATGPECVADRFNAG